MKRIEQSVAKIIQSLPPHVTLVAAAKTKTPDEVKTAIRAGVGILGYNYVQEAERVRERIDRNSVKWHMIGHLQRNKARKAVTLFDMIETIDSLRLAQRLDAYCAEDGRIMPVLIEINSGAESNKTGILPGEVDALVWGISNLSHLRLYGLMTMGPRFGDPEDARPYFQATKAVFDRLRQANIPNVRMEYLSMGMSNSYKIAIEEGANIVRIGTKLFGERPSGEGS
jgi:pyridoxal phosphate enzyme (YggS family)